IQTSGTQGFAVSSASSTWYGVTRYFERKSKNSDRLIPSISAPLLWDTTPSSYHLATAARFNSSANSSGPCRNAESAPWGTVTVTVTSIRECCPTWGPPPEH